MSWVTTLRVVFWTQGGGGAGVRAGQRDKGAAKYANAGILYYQSLTYITDSAYTPDDFTMPLGPVGQTEASISNVGDWTQSPDGAFESLPNGGGDNIAPIGPVNYGSQNPPIPPYNPMATRLPPWWYLIAISDTFGQTVCPGLIPLNISIPVFNGWIPWFC